jgi:hypothetical protein
MDPVSMDDKTNEICQAAEVSNMTIGGGHVKLRGEPGGLVH